ncbi:MAG: right-handed parallel beta-helix repeat-containing protein [Bacteroidota bacterium]|jgi:hypothetical protein
MRNTKKTFLFCYAFALAISMLSTSCKKPVLLSKGNLTFSKDTVVFDTVFTTIGSTTQQFKIYNNDNRTVNIEEIELMGGSSSPFRLNIDGIPGENFSDVEIEGKDSLFAFVEVTLDINGQNLPMIVEDSIRLRTNGVDQFVKLAVWGQDAYFHYKEVMNTQTWMNDKPHVIYGYAAIDSAQTLTVPGGTDIFLHKNAILYVYKGTLNMEGSLGNEVTLQGDRLEPWYDDVAGQYYGIYFQEARPSTINYAIIKNGTTGIHMFSKDPLFSSDYTLTITNSKIFNNASYGIFLYSGPKLKAENCVIAKNGYHALLVLEGADFNINHCNLLGYGSAQAPAVGISNFYNDFANQTQNIGSINEGVIYNSVIFGNLESEIAFDTIPDAGITLSFDFRNCLIKRVPTGTDNFYSSILWNHNPLFTNVGENDFTFPTTSKLNNNGFFTSVTNDINGNPRNDPPDIGAYEN